jgi:Mn2+/Fe2+ NRAMP family transporter
MSGSAGWIVVTSCAVSCIRAARSVYTDALITGASPSAYPGLPLHLIEIIRKPNMTDDGNPVEQERQQLANAEATGGWQKYRTYFRLSGPGWIASAITLGGGSLASSLYLGVLGGYSLLWLQPFAMVLGVIMLGAIGYVTLSTGERPFSAINEHVSPVLGWGWALAVAAANVIWCMPQHSLAYGVLSQNLLPNSWFGAGSAPVNWATATFGQSWPWLAANFDKLVVSFAILCLATIITWSYNRGGWGLRLYEISLKIIVALIVACFLGVVIRLALSPEPLDWSSIFAGLIPDFGQFFRPADTFLPYLQAIGDAGSAAREFWNDKIVAEQRDVMIGAAATAVGINMTLMFPYTMLRKGWTKEFRGLSLFDLSTGMFIPYVLATGCVVIAAGSRFHTELPEGFSLQEIGDGSAVVQVDEDGPKYGAYQKLLTERNDAVAPVHASATSDAEKRLAAMLVRRDAIDLAGSLAPLTGKFVANIIFGLGVLAMVLSTISILMLISGFVFAEMMGYPPGGVAHKLGTLVAGVGGALWPLFWAGDSQFFLAVVTSVIGFMLLPFAYVTFVFLMNSKSLLGSEMPRGGKRLLWNVLAIGAATIVTIGAGYMLRVKGEDLASKTGMPGAANIGFIAVGLYVLLALMVGLNRRNRAKRA